MGGLDAAYPQPQVGLVGVAGVEADPRGGLHRLIPIGLARGAIGQVPELGGDLVHEALVDGTGCSDHQAPRRVPGVQVVEERLAPCRPDRLLGADDVPAQRLVAEQQVVIHTVDVIAGRVHVHVQLFDDDALLPLDLIGVEL